MITYGIKEMMAEAEAVVPVRTAEQVLALHGRPDVVLVDVREAPELKRRGIIPGAVHVPRGLLEMKVDPAHRRHDPVFARDAEFVVY